MTVNKNGNASKRHITEVTVRTATTPPAPSVYRPQPTPKVLQRKAETTPRARPPIAQTKVASASPSVLQAKQTAVQSPVSPAERAQSVSRMVPRAAATIQRAVAAPGKKAVGAEKKLATTVRATFNVVWEDGHSGNGAETGRLLEATPTAAARKFLRILRAVKPMRERSGFTCAEPNAVAKLLARPDGPQTEDDLWFRVNVKTAWDSRGGKSPCPVCSQWVSHGKIADITGSGAAVSASGAAPRTTFNLMDFVKKPKPKRGGGGGGGGDEAPGGDELKPPGPNNGGGGGLPPPPAAT